MSKVLYYVIDIQHGFVVHEGNEASCKEYMDTVQYYWNKAGKNFAIGYGAKNRDAILKANGF